MIRQDVIATTNHQNWSLTSRVELLDYAPLYHMAPVARVAQTAKLFEPRGGISVDNRIMHSWGPDRLGAGQADLDVIQPWWDGRLRALRVFWYDPNIEV